MVSNDLEYSFAEYQKIFKMTNKISQNATTLGAVPPRHIDAP